MGKAALVTIIIMMEELHKTSVYLAIHIANGVLLPHRMLALDVGQAHIGLIMGILV